MRILCTASKYYIHASWQSAGFWAVLINLNGGVVLHLRSTLGRPPCAGSALIFIKARISLQIKDLDGALPGYPQD